MQAKKLSVECLEQRSLLTVVCNANPVYASECTYLGNLIPQSTITDTAVKSGNWSDVTTWSNGVPKPADNVWIPSGLTVTVDAVEPASLHSILDNGLLTFAPNVNTSLLVDTIIVGTDDANGVSHGELDVGTTADPIQPHVTATITFADDGTLTQAWPSDTAQLARGLISMNTVSIVGSQVTPYIPVNGSLAAGTQTFSLNQAPVGWKAGDTMLLPGTSETANQDEQITIASISGNTVTLSSPLAYSHTAASGVPVYAVNETRNVVFQSQNTTDYERFGDVMFMHTDQEVVENAAFLHLGRTDKSLPLGATNPDGTKNVDGRYAVHFHRDYWPGMSDNDPPVLVSGNFEEGAAGWGYDQHSSYADFEDNVAYDNNGAGFATQAGNEIGTFNGNMAVRSTTTIASPTAYSTIVMGQATNDFGKTGVGFWMQSPSVSLTNNVALDNVTGYVFWNQAISTPGLIDPHTGFIPSFNGQDTREMPLAGFSDNTAAYGQAGLQLFHHLQNIGVTDFVPGQQSVIDWFTSYATTVGIDVDNYVSSVAIQNSSLAGDGTLHSVGITTSLSFTTDIAVYNSSISGFALGYLMPTFGNDPVTGCSFDGATSMEIPEIRPGLNYFLTTRGLNFSSNSFGPHVTKQYLWDTNTFDLYTPEVDFIPQSVWIDGVEQYFAYQAPDFVPFPSLRTSMPAAFIGLTNDQLRQQYGLVDGGFETGEQAPFFYTLLSLPNTSSQSYTLSYQTPEGIVNEAVTLQPGPNVLTRTVDGALHSWIVDYFVPTTTVQSFQGSPGSLANLPLTVSRNGTTTTITGTFDPATAVQGVELLASNFTYGVDLENGVLTISRIAPIKSVTLPPSSSYQFSITVNTSTYTISVTVNGVKYF